MMFLHLIRNIALIFCFIILYHRMSNGIVKHKILLKSKKFSAQGLSGLLGRPILFYVQISLFQEKRKYILIFTKKQNSHSFTRSFSLNSNPMYGEQYFTKIKTHKLIPFLHLIQSLDHKHRATISGDDKKNLSLLFY